MSNLCYRPAALFEGDPRSSCLIIGDKETGIYQAPTGPAGPQVFQPTGGAFKSMPSPKVSAALFDFSQSSAKDGKDAKTEQPKWSASVPSSPVTRRADETAQQQHLQLHQQVASYFTHEMHQSYYRPQSSSMVCEPGSSSNAMNKHVSSSAPFYPPSPSPRQQQPNYTWAGASKPSVIVSKSNSASNGSSVGAGAAGAGGGGGGHLPAGSISNGTPIRPPSREPASSAQCFAGVMNIKSGTLCGTLTPVTLADLSRPSKVKATTASIPVANNADVCSGGGLYAATNNNRHAITPGTPITPGSAEGAGGGGSVADPPGLMPPPELPKFVLAPTPAQLGLRAPFQRRQSSSSSSSSATAAQSGDGSPTPCQSDDESSPSPGGSAAYTASAGQVPPYSPIAATAAVSGGFTVPAGPSTPNVPPSPGQSIAAQAAAAAAKKIQAKRNKDDGMDRQVSIQFSISPLSLHPHLIITIETLR